MADYKRENLSILSWSPLYKVVRMASHVRRTGHSTTRSNIAIQKGEKEFQGEQTHQLSPQNPNHEAKIEIPMNEVRLVEHVG